MYMIIRDHGGDNGVDYFGPFPTQDRAFAYAASFGIEEGEECKSTVTIVPLIVPNCVQVKTMY